MKPDIARLGCIVLGALALGSAAAGEDLARWKLPIGTRGSLEIDVASDWQFSPLPLDSPPSVSLRFGPPSNDFNFKITSVWLDADQRVPLATIKERVRDTAAQSLPSSLETDAKLIELRGSQTEGYYFSLTDKAESSDTNYKYMTQGIAVTGPVTTAFTLLSRFEDRAQRERALRLISSATWSDLPLIVAAADIVSLQVEEPPDAYRVTVPVSRLTLSIPKGSLQKTKTDNPSSRYFLFMDKAHRLIVSGWFEAAQGFEGLEKLWADDTSSWKQKQLPDPEDVSFTKAGGWDAVIYEQRDGKVTRSHLRAAYVAAGTWIDVHLSTAGKASPSEARAELLDTLGAMRVQERK